MPDPESVQPLGDQSQQQQQQQRHISVNKAYEEHNANVEWFSVCSCISFWVCNGFSLVFIVFGFVYLNDCPMQSLR